MSVEEITTSSDDVRVRSPGNVEDVDLPAVPRHLATMDSQDRGWRDLGVVSSGRRRQGRTPSIRPVGFSTITTITSVRPTRCPSSIRLRAGEDLQRRHENQSDFTPGVPWSIRGLLPRRTVKTVFPGGLARRRTGTVGNLVTTAVGQLPAELLARSADYAVDELHPGAVVPSSRLVIFEAASRPMPFPRLIRSSRRSQRPIRPAVYLDSITYNKGAAVITMLKRLCIVTPS